MAIATDSATPPMSESPGRCYARMRSRPEPIVTRHVDREYRGGDQPHPCKLADSRWVGIWNRTGK